MKSLFAITGTVLLLVLAVGFSAARQTTTDIRRPVEIAVLSEENWDQFVPDGKEVDAIYGDIVLRNGHLTAVIAQPLATRNANMTVRNVAGAIIDLTVQGSGNDQLAAFFPGKTLFPYRSLSVINDQGQEQPLTAQISSTKFGAVAVKADAADNRPEAKLSYELHPEDRFVTITTTFTNRSQQPQTVPLEDDLRADGGKEEMVRTPNGTADRFWLDDRFWGQAYGVDSSGKSFN